MPLKQGSQNRRAKAKGLLRLWLKRLGGGNLTFCLSNKLPDDAAAKDHPLCSKTPKTRGCHDSNVPPGAEGGDSKREGSLGRS